MFPDLNNYRFYLKPGTTDMRKALNGLSVIIQNEMNRDIFEKSLFLFCNRQRKLLKVVYWDDTGFCLWQKRLEKERFPWPETEEKASEISHDELLLLLKGIDLFKVHKKLKYKRI